MKTCDNYCDALVDLGKVNKDQMPDKGATIFDLFPFVQGRAKLVV